MRDTLLRLDGLIKGGRPRTPHGQNGNIAPHGNHDAQLSGPMPPTTTYGGNFQTGEYPHPGYQNGGVVQPLEPSANASLGITMPLTAREIQERHALAQAQGQGHNPQHQPSYYTNSRSQSPNAAEPGYEMNEFGSPISPVASEVHSDSIAPPLEQRHASMVSAMDERVTQGRLSPGYVVGNDGYLDAGGYSRGQYRRDAS